MIKKLFILFLFINLKAARNPFCFGNIESEIDDSKIICKGIGKLNEKKIALISYKNKTEVYKVGEKIFDKEIISISDDNITLKNKNGNVEKIFLE